MKPYITTVLLFFCLGFLSSLWSQNISLYKQLNGRYDFVFIGNTLNPDENSFQVIPSVFTSSSAFLNLNPNDVVEKAYLYWAGSGTGDFDVKLNGQDIKASRTFGHRLQAINLDLDYFSAFEDITTLVKSTGSGNYTLSELDVSPFIDQHGMYGTNFAGWAIIVVYKNQNLPLNQINIYDGMQAMPNEINVSLTNLNVIDNKNAKIGFIAWEGDAGIAVNETLSINGNLISNPPLNPVNNAFNGTNSFTNSNTLYNMDLDVYGIQNNIKIGDTSAQIRLTSGQDFVMVNAIITKLNSQLPDATIAINEIKTSCDSKKIVVNYSVSNLNSTDGLPANLPISIYINNLIYKTVYTTATIPIDGTISNQITVDVPQTALDLFDLKFTVDDIGNNTGTVTEIDEKNNSDQQSVQLHKSPTFNTLIDKESCNETFSKGTFNFSNYETTVKTNSLDKIQFYESLKDAQNATNPIFNTVNYSIQSALKTIYIRLENEFCNSYTSFNLIVKNCKPEIYNYISPNNDGFNDRFHINGLKNIFLNHSLSIYNRWGTLVWTGNNNTEEWDGNANQGILMGERNLPSGTYYYVLDLNDPGYDKPLMGYLFLSR